MIFHPAPLFRFSYVSAAAADLTEADLTEIARASWRNNHRRQLTGFLEHRDGAFHQAMEGRPGDISYLLAAILADHRHHAIRVEAYEAASDRSSAGFEIRGFPSPVSQFAPAAPSSGPRLVSANDRLIRPVEGPARRRSGS